MTDREKVIKGLEELYGFLFREYANIHAEESKIYYERTCAIRDALAMLKEQPEDVAELQKERDEFGESLNNAVELIRKKNERIEKLLKEREAVKPRVSMWEQRCGNCNKVIEMDGWIACPWCGKPIDWESR